MLLSLTFPLMSQRNLHEKFPEALRVHINFQMSYFTSFLALNVVWCIKWYALQCIYITVEWSIFLIHCLDLYVVIGKWCILNFLCDVYLGDCMRKIRIKIYVEVNWYSKCKFDFILEIYFHMNEWKNPSRKIVFLESDIDFLIKLSFLKICKIERRNSFSLYFDR